MATTSIYLSARSVRAFERIGAIMMPRDAELPSFEELGCIAHVDDIMEHVPPDDLAPLNTLLFLLSFLPTPLLRGFVSLVERGPDWSGPVGGFFRMLNTGLRSVIVTLYFSGKAGPGYQGPTPLDAIGYHINPIR